MSFSSLLIHKAHVYQFDTSSRDDYNNPILSLSNGTATNTPIFSNISCRLQHFLHKAIGTPQQEVEFIEEKPATLFIEHSTSGFNPTSSNYVFHFSIDTSNFYIIQEMKAMYRQISTPHHYELLVVPFNEIISSPPTAPS